MLQDLNDSMLSHLKLHFNTSERNDEAVLGAYPSTIRRRVLRYLYLDVLQVCQYYCGAGALESAKPTTALDSLPSMSLPSQVVCDVLVAGSVVLEFPAGAASLPTCDCCRCYTHFFFCPLRSSQSSQLFDGARQRFLDALLAAARVEVYLPNVRLPLTIDCMLLCSHLPPGMHARRASAPPGCCSACWSSPPALKPQPAWPPACRLAVGKRAVLTHHMQAQVELVSEGDSVNELFIVVSGQLSSYRTSNLFNPEASSWEAGLRLP